MTGNTIIKTAEFISSFSEHEKISLPGNPEYAFTGRSNVGKSSLINMITGRTSLAKTSVKPGKTRLFNLFLVNETWNLMDLPGFGYAKVSKKEREAWDVRITGYLRSRKNLVTVFVLVDANIPPQKIDLDFIQYLGENHIPLCIVFTKCDKSKLHQLNKNILSFKSELSKTWEELPLFFKTSSVTKSGRDDILEFIRKTNEETVPYLSNDFS